MLSIAVCDDEIIECCNMEKRIKKMIEEMKIPCIIRQFRSGGELLQALESFDIVFLDIMMPEMDGMKTAQLFRKKASDKILIFVSSSREYVFEAYDVEAFQYLLKPVEDRKLKNVLQKAVLKTERRSQEFIIVSSQRQKKKLFLDDIYYFEIKGRIVDAHGPEGIFTYYEQMGELENKLQDKGFFGFVKLSGQSFCCVSVSCIFHRIGGGAVPIRQGKKDSGCICAGGGQAGSRFLGLFFVVSGTGFPAHSEKDPGTIF